MIEDARRELLRRADALAGVRVADLARAHGNQRIAGGVHQKGRVGELLERALGADGGSGQRIVDFPALGIELKTIPVDLEGRPLESTFVCAIRLDEEVSFEDSWVYRKLARVLFVPIVGPRKGSVSERRIGHARLWEPSASELHDLKLDYDEIMGLIAIGRVEEVSAHLGQRLQLRPKAADGKPRAVATGRDGERIPTVPRGFYLRATFTRQLLKP